MSDQDGMPLASLIWDARPPRAEIAVLVLHGGAAQGRQPNRPWSHNTIRLWPFGRALARIDGPIAVARLRFRYRGWNGPEASPQADTRWALAQLRTDYPGARLALVGHSMGARAALTVAAREDDVQLVVGLASWIEAGDARPQNGSRTVLIHGDRDRLCPLSGARRTVETLRHEGADASLVRVARSDHAMLIRPRVWTKLVTGVVEATFADDLGPKAARVGSDPVGQVVDGVVNGGGFFEL